MGFSLVEALSIGVEEISQRSRIEVGPCCAGPYTYLDCYRSETYDFNIDISHRKLGNVALSLPRHHLTNNWSLHTPRAEPNSIAVGTTGEGYFNIDTSIKSVLKVIELHVHLPGG